MLVRLTSENTTRKTTMQRYTLKTDEAQARERMNAFWAQSSIGRPAIHLTARNRNHTDTPWNGTSDIKTRELMPDYQVIRTHNAIHSVHWLAEAFPSVLFSWGSTIGMPAVLAGADYDFSTQGAWIRPIPDIMDRPLPVFDPHHPMMVTLEQGFRAIAKSIGDKGYINPPIMLDGLTTLSLMREAENLCMDLLACPDQVKAWSNALTTLYIKSYDYFHQLLKTLGYPETSAWLGTLAPGSMEAVQCDFGVMMSPDMYREFALPDLLRLTDYLQYSLYHLDGVEQMRFIDILRECPKLNGIQWNPQPGSGSHHDHLADFKEIRKRKFSLMVECYCVDDAVMITQELGPDGLFIKFPKPFNSVDEAEGAVRAIQEAC